MWTKEDTDILLKAVSERGPTKWSKMKKDYPQLAKYNAPGALRGRYLTCLKHLNQQKNGVTCKCGKVVNKPWRLPLKCHCGIPLKELVEYISENFKNIVWILGDKVSKDIPEISSNLYFVQSKNYQIVKDIFEKKLCIPVVNNRRDELNESFCMVSDNCCTCLVKCVYRLLFNNLQSKKIWNGLPESIVKREYLKYTATTPEFLNDCGNPELTIDWFNKVISRNKNLKENSIISYKYTIKKIFEYNLQNSMWDPFNLLSLNLHFEILGPFKNIIWYISDSELYKLYGEKSRCMRPMYSRALSLQRETKLRESQKRSQKDNDNWCSVDDIKDMIVKMDNDSIYDFQKIVWFKMQIYMHCLRNEYSTLMVTGYNLYTDNFIKDNLIVLNNYKTVKTHGRIEIPVTVDDVIKLYNLRLSNGCSHLFMNNKNQPFKKSEFSRFIINASMMHLGKRIGSRLLRKITITEALKDEVTLVDKLNLASKMLHTSSTQQTYRKCT